MEKVKLVVSRKNSFVGYAMPIRVKINGLQIGQVKVGQKLELDVPCQPLNLELDMVGNSMSIHPIKKTFVINPAQSPRGVVMVDFGVKGKMLGILTSGMAGKVGDIEADIKYI